MTERDRESTDAVEVANANEGARTYLGGVRLSGSEGAEPALGSDVTSRVGRSL